MPEPQTLLIVVQGTLSGSPAKREAWRAGAWPTPAGSTQPLSVSSICSGTSSARSSAAAIATAPSCGADFDESSPWNAPIGVRAPDRITVSELAMGALCVSCASGRQSQPENSWPDIDGFCD